MAKSQETYFTLLLTTNKAAPIVPCTFETAFVEFMELCITYTRPTI